MRQYFFILFVFFLCFHAETQAQVHCTASSKEKCEKHLTQLREQDLADKSIQAVAMAVAKSFLGTPYVAKTLEIEGKERLVIELDGLDCTTFLENVVVFSRIAKKEKLDFESFQKELMHLRYRNGDLEAYPSRLHYFSDWIYNNSEKDLIRDITAEIGGIPYEKHINFMSTHTKSYRQLSDETFVEKIRDAEAAINKRTYHYIPKAKLARLESKIQSGDLIAITTGIKGLDIVHVGFAIRSENDNRIHLFHASTSSNQVEISAKPLADYLMGNKSQSGVMVCRLVEP